ncbi:hypothetical protein MIDIC_550001 [Alphaproteobacteria bacterium]
MADGLHTVQSPQYAVSNSGPQGSGGVVCTKGGKDLFLQILAEQSETLKQKQEPVVREEHAGMEAKKQEPGVCVANSSTDKNISSCSAEEADSRNKIQSNTFLLKPVELNFAENRNGHPRAVFAAKENDSSTNEFIKAEMEIRDIKFPMTDSAMYASSQKCNAPKSVLQVSDDSSVSPLQVILALPQHSMVAVDALGGDKTEESSDGVTTPSMCVMDSMPYPCFIFPVSSSTCSSVSNDLQLHYCKNPELGDKAGDKAISAIIPHQNTYFVVNALKDVNLSETHNHIDNYYDVGSNRAESMIDDSSSIGTNAVIKDGNQQLPWTGNAAQFLPLHNTSVNNVSTSIAIGSYNRALREELGLAVVKQVVVKINGSSLDEKQTIKVQLKPENLGIIDIVCRINNGKKCEMQISVEKLTTLHLLRQHSLELKQLVISAVAEKHNTFSVYDSNLNTKEGDVTVKMGLLNDQGANFAQNSNGNNSPTKHQSMLMRSIFGETGSVLRDTAEQPALADMCLYLKYGDSVNVLI